MSDDDAQRSYLPVIMAALVLVVGGAKLEAARPLVARTLAVAIPVVPVLLAMKRVEGGGERLERAAGIVSWATLLTGEACVIGTIFQPQMLSGVMPFARALLYVIAPAALVVHTLEARSLGKARFAGYVGIALGFAFYVSGHVGKDVFASVFGAFFVGFFAGGGGGLLVGEVLGRVFKQA
jgi:hypothetical protein